MDIRFLLILAVVAAVMEILGRLARKGAGTGAPRVPGPDGADPLMQQLEELEWVPGAHDGDDEKPVPHRERAPVERPAVAAAPAPAAVPERVREPRPLPPEPVMVLRDRAPRPVPVRSREPRPAEARPVEARRSESRPVEPYRVRPRPAEPHPAEREAPASGGGATGAGGRLGLGTVGGLRRLVVAREVLGPPIALRDGAPET